MKIKVILLLLTAALFNLSYNNTGKKPAREIIVNSGDSVIVAHLSLNERKIKTSPRKTYYWHRQGKIFNNVGDYGGTLLENSYQVFLNDKLIESGEFYKGTKNGTWFFWNDDGTLNNILYYKKGILKDKEFKHKPAKKNRLKIIKKESEKTRESKWFGKKIKSKENEKEPKRPRKKTKEENESFDENYDDIQQNETENNAVEIIDET